MLNKALSVKRVASFAVAGSVVLALALVMSVLSARDAPRTSASSDLVSPSTSTTQCEVKEDLDVVMVIDRTGSMNDLSGGQTKLHWAKQAALALVNGMAGGAGSSTLGGSHAEVLTFDGAAAATRVIAFSSDANAVRAAINGIGDSSGAGDTYIAKGIEGATADLNAHVHGSPYGSYKVVVLLSDGRNWNNRDSSQSCPFSQQRRQDTVNDIPALHDAADTVYAVGVGSQTGSASSCDYHELDEALLQAIVEGPPGDYTHVTDASSLPDIYSGISQDIINICASFSGHKYDDLACDGQAGSNPPLSGVDIKLLNAQGTQVAETSTDANGVYSFANIPEGTYSICEDLSAMPGRTQSYPVSGTANTGTHAPYGVCYERTLARGYDESGLDFYNCPPTVPTSTPTSTPVVPPTSTNTPVVPPTSTNTPVVPPTSTNTPVVPPTSTNTPVVPPTATRTGEPTATATREHHATKTPTERASTPTTVVVPATRTPVSQVSAYEETRPSARGLPPSGYGTDGGSSSLLIVAAAAVLLLVSTGLLLSGFCLARRQVRSDK